MTAENSGSPEARQRMRSHVYESIDDIGLEQIEALDGGLDFSFGLLRAIGHGRSRGARLLPRGIAGPLRLAGAATLGGLASRSQAFTTARDLLHQGPVFDTYRADMALAPLGIKRPAPERWLEKIVQRAEERGWK